MNITPDIEEQARHWFVQLRDADVPVSAWLAFQDWLEQDAGHALAYDAIERLWVDLDDAGSQPVFAPIAANDIVATASRRIGGSGRARPRWLAPVIGIAAAMVVVVGVWPQIEAFISTKSYHTEAEPQTVELSDGSHIYLNRHSDLTIRMQADRRTVTLADGEAAFDVTHDAARPFVIHAEDRDVRVLGTAFNVVNHQGRFSVSVSRGVVAVTPSKASTPVRLTVGQRIDQVGSGQPLLSQGDPDRASAWRQGVLIYRDAPLGDVANDLSRYFDKPVTVASSAQSLHFTGALRVGDEATMLKQLQDFLPVQTSRSATDVRLTARDGR